jgi:hypothetical protein
MCAAAVLAVVVARMRAKHRTWFSSSCFHLDSYAETCCLPYALYSSLLNSVIGQGVVGRGMGTHVSASSANSYINGGLRGKQM